MQQIGVRCPFAEGPSELLFTDLEIAGEREVGFDLNGERYRGERVHSTKSPRSAARGVMGSQPR